MRKILNIYFVVLAMISTLFVFSGCDTDTEYPIWFNEYSGDVLNDLKSAQDAFNCFGNSIGSNIVIFGVYSSTQKYPKLQFKSGPLFCSI